MIDYTLDILRHVFVLINTNSFYVTTILALIIIFFQRRDPKSVWAWLLLLYSIPILGFTLYLLIGHDYHKSHMFKVKEIEDKLNATIKKQETELDTNETFVSELNNDMYCDLIKYNLQTSSAIYSDNNDVVVFTDGKAKFNALKESLKKAKHFIHIQYYIISKGTLFSELLDILEMKAKNGVEVRILCDGVGSRNIGRRNLWRMKRAGIKVGIFFPAFLGRFQFRFNYRNHRKIVVIDGHTAYVGGFNIGDEYLGHTKKFGYWRDTHLKIKGDAVNDLHIRFILDWNYATKENLFKSKDYFSPQHHKHYDGIGMQIISSGPDSKRQEIRDNYLKLITSAKERIYIQTPYFIPDESITNALKIAAFSGVDVKLMIPSKPDHPFVYWVTYAYVGELLESGVKCYCYDNGFLHAKGIVVDGSICSYGTANMDIRSFALNFEVNAVIYNTRLSNQMERIFISDLEKCTELTKYNYDRRSLVIRIREQISRLLAPLM